MYFLMFVEFFRGDVFKTLAEFLSLPSFSTRAAVAAPTTCIFGFRLGLSLGYGLDFLPCALALERGTLH
jgi:hypothetical protein